MALIKVTKEMGSTPGIVDNSDATAITIDSSENVGIGTGAPGDKLEVSRTSTSQTVGLTLTNLQAGGYGSGIVWQSKRSDAPNAIKDAGKIIVSGESSWNSDGNTASQMQFWTNKDNTLTQHMTLTKNGNLGIGIANPANPLSISVQTHGLYSQHRPSNSNGVGQEMYYKFNTADGTPEIFSSIYSEIESNANGAESGKIALRAANAGSLTTGLILIGSTGYIGIGEPSPDTNLHINRGAGGTAFKVETTSGQHTIQGSDASGTYIEQTGTTTATRKFRLQNQDGSNNYTQVIIDGANRRVEVVPGLDVHDVGTVYTGAGRGKGTIHLDPNSATDFTGNAITFGASDNGEGQIAHAGIYTRTDGTLGTEMHLSTTDSYSAGSQTGIKISNTGNVTVPRGYLAAKQPSAIARGVGAWQTSYPASAWNELHTLCAFTQYSNSVGAPWSDTTGRFTAPISGYYLCSVSIYTNQQNAGSHGARYIHPQFAKNGNVNIHGITPYQIFGHNDTLANSYATGIGRTDIIYVPANQYVTVQLYIAGSGWQFYRNYCSVSFCLISAV